MKTELLQICVWIYFSEASCLIYMFDAGTKKFNPLNAELNPICYLLALLAHHFLHVSRIRVKLPVC